MRCAVIGGVNSTGVLLHCLQKHGFRNVKVWGFSPPSTELISGWCDLKMLSQNLGFDHDVFRKISECEIPLTQYKPELLFVVGLSQIVPQSILSIASKANVGFHPTFLPEGRGRAAIAWMILNQINGAATFFSLRNGVDDGPIFVQEPFFVTDEDDAGEVETKVLDAEERALDRWLPKLLTHDFSTFDQDHRRATWLGRRTPKDGQIDWNCARKDVLKLIRASAPPNPGAFSFCGDIKVLLLKAAFSDRPETGVVGRILSVDSNQSFEIQAADGLLTIYKWQSSRDWMPTIGMKLGYYLDSEIFELRSKVHKLEQKVQDLQRTLDCLHRK